jgi:hypothetical protein
MSSAPPPLELAPQDWVLPPISRPRLSGENGSQVRTTGLVRRTPERSRSPRTSVSGPARNGGQRFRGPGPGKWRSPWCSRSNLTRQRAEPDDVQLRLAKRAQHLDWAPPHWSDHRCIVQPGRYPSRPARRRRQNRPRQCAHRAVAEDIDIVVQLQLQLETILTAPSTLPPGLTNQTQDFSSGLCVGEHTSFSWPHREQGIPNSHGERPSPSISACNGLQSHVIDLDIPRPLESA